MENVEAVKSAAAPVIIKKCMIEDCKRPYRAKGYCEVHYQKWRRGELPHPRYKTCGMPDCRKKRFQGSLCEEHFKIKKTAKGKAPKAEVKPEEDGAPVAQEGKPVEEKKAEANPRPPS